MDDSFPNQAPLQVPSIEPVQPVQIDTVVEPPQMPEPVVVASKKSRKRIILLGLLLVFVIGLFGGGAVLAYGITYNKVDIGGPKVKQAVSSFVMSLPFTPKTPEYLLGSMVAAHQQVSTSSFDILLAINTGSSGLDGDSSNYEIRANGEIDLADKDNLKLSANIENNVDFDADLFIDGNNFYFRLMKIPGFLGLGSDASNGILNKWVYAKAPEKSSFDPSEETPIDPEKSMAIYTNIVEKGFFDSITVSETTVGDEPVYKLATRLDDSDLNLFEEAIQEEYPLYSGVNLTSSPSEPVDIELYIGKKDYLIRKINASGTIKQSGALENFGISESKISLTLDFAAIGQPFTAQKPDAFISLEEFLGLILGTGGPVSGNLIDPGKQFSQARDAQRTGDLYAVTNAVYQYAAEHNGNLPGEFPTSQTCIGTSPQCFDLGSAGGPDSIVPTYIAAIPSDPAIGTSQNTGYTIQVMQTGRVEAHATGELTPDIVIVR